RIARVAIRFAVDDNVSLSSLKSVCKDPLMQAFIPRLLAVAVLSCCMQLHAAPLDTALEESQRLAAEAKASQARIEQLDDATRQMLNEYRNAVQQAEALKAYNAQLVEL